MPAGLGSRSAWEPAEPDLVSVGVSVGDLTHAIGVGLLLRWLQSPLSYACHQGVEVINDDGMPCMAGMFGLMDDEHQPVFGEFPHGLGVIRVRRWRGAEQPLVPGQCCGVVADWYPCEQVNGHDAMLGGPGRTPWQDHVPWQWRRGQPQLPPFGVWPCSKGVGSRVAPDGANLLA